MRSYVNTHPDFDFAIGYVRPERTFVKMCEDCRERPSRPHSACCYTCGKRRENALLRTIGAPFVP